jgi:hypothetical protein
MSDLPVKSSKKYLARPVPSDRRWILDRLNEIRGQLGMPVEQFVRQYLSRSYTVYHRVTHDKYHGAVDQVLADYERDIKRLEEMLKAREFAAPKSSLDDIYITKTMEFVFKAIHEASARSDNQKLIIVLAKHGQGKSTMCQMIHQKFGFHIAFATQSWAQSYYAGCSAVNHTLGDSGPWRGTYEVENALWKNLSNRCTGMCVDNANTFGPHSCNMVRDGIDIAGKPWVIFCLPAFFDRMRQDSFWQSAQMIRRGVVIEAQDIKKEEVAHIIRNCGLNGTTMEAAARIAIAANKFAHYGYVHRVREYLQEKHRDGATIDNVDHAIRVVNVMFRQHKIGSK